jgi:zinc transporter, ZIP family
MIFIFIYLPTMTLAIGLAALTALFTALGGLLALRARDRLHLVLGLAAGLLLGLVAFELLPEVFSEDTGEIFHVPGAAVALIAGFFALHLFEQFSGGHEPADSDYGHDHKHSAPVVGGNIAGTLGALGMGGHVFLDGVALGVAFQISRELGLAVFVAVLVHAFSDGLNTVSLLIKSGHWTKKGAILLGVDAVARISGAAVGSYLVVNQTFLSLYLALFAGMLIYLSTSHILPEAHARHSSRWTLLATLAGILIMWGLVSQIHSSDIHAHTDHGSHESDHSHDDDDSDHSHDDDDSDHSHDDDE